MSKTCLNNDNGYEKCLKLVFRTRNSVINRKMIYDGLKQALSSGEMSDLKSIVQSRSKSIWFVGFKSTEAVNRVATKKMVTVD